MNFRAGFIADFVTEIGGNNFLERLSVLISSDFRIRAEGDRQKSHTAQQWRNLVAVNATENSDGVKPTR